MKKVEMLEALQAARHGLDIGDPAALHVLADVLEELAKGHEDVRVGQVWSDSDGRRWKVVAIEVGRAEIAMTYGPANEAGARKKVPVEWIVDEYERQLP